MKPIAVISILSIFFAIFLIGIIHPPAGSEKNFSKLDIPNGISFNEITERVYLSGLVKSKLSFKIFSLLSGRAHRFQAGSYSFDNPPSVNELTKILISGPKEISVTIFPGMTLKEIDDLLSELKIIGPNELVNYNNKLISSNFDNLKIQYPHLSKAKSLEGFLLPDTYFFYENSGAQIAVEKMLDNFGGQVLPFLKGGGNILDTLIIASLLEKEIPDSKERQVAAGIIKKRLKVGMPLQIDATVIYAKCSGRFLNCPALQKDDYKFDSFYNTYFYAGLPPTPISNPSKNATIAAQEPRDSQYWYYLSDPKTKKTIFSKDLDEHNINRAKYLLLK